MNFLSEIIKCIFLCFIIVTVKISLKKISNICKNNTDINNKINIKDFIFIYGCNKNLDSYQYRINPFIDDNEFYHVENRELRHEIYKLENKLAQLEYMTELVIEVGDIHE